MTAVSRGPGQLDIVVAGTDGGVWTAARAPGGGWAGWWRIGDLVVPQGAYIGGAVSRGLDQLDIFATDEHGRTMTAAWNPSNGETWAGWWELNGGRAAPGAPITAVSRSADRLDLLVTGSDGGVWTGRLGADQHRRVGWLVAGRRSRGPAGRLHRRAVAQHRPARRFRHRQRGADHDRRVEPSNGDTWAGWWELNGGRAAPGSPVIPSRAAPASSTYS